MFEEIMHVLWHSFIDSIKILPVLFLLYVLIEVIENKCVKNWKKQSFLNNKYSPLVAGGVGIIPQCGFSVVATDLFAEKKIAVGTLLAVYIATSDEAVPILLAQSGDLNVLKYLGLLILIKFVYAVTIGYLVNFIVGKISKTNTTSGITIETEGHKHKSKESKKEEHAHDYGCCGHDIAEEEPTFKKFILHPLKHSLKIFLFIFIVNLAFGLLLEYVPLEDLSKIMLNDSIFQPFVVALLGLIPNCASSVLITNLFITEGLISFASCIAGLCVNAGVALVVLFKSNRNVKQNILIVATLYLVSTILGFVLQFLIV